jgi:FAD/FMN-containing dehydrogenase
VELIAPSDAGYDRLRAVFDQRVDHRPAVVARCRSRDDVAAALALAGARDLPHAVRGGAADAGATIDGGVVIDVSPMKGVEIDAAARTARVAAGVTWAELDAAAQQHGLAVTGARVSWLGVAGVALGAGSGWLERSLGPTGSSVLRAEGVLPDGSTVTATGTAAPTGAVVVTELVLQLHPVGPELLCGFLTFPRARAGEVARAYRELMVGAPAEAGGALTLFAGRAGACQLAVCFHGDVADGERWIARLRALAPSLDAVAANPYRGFQAMTDTLHPFGMRAERVTRPVGSLSDELLDALLAAAEQPAAALSRLVLRPRGGRLEGDPWEAECLAMWPPVASLDRGNLSWLERVSAAVTDAGAAASEDLNGRVLPHRRGAAAVRGA